MCRRFQNDMDIFNYLRSERFLCTNLDQAEQEEFLKCLDRIWDVQIDYYKQYMRQAFLRVALLYNPLREAGNFCDTMLSLLNENIDEWQKEFEGMRYYNASFIFAFAEQIQDEYLLETFTRFLEELWWKGRK